MLSSKLDLIPSVFRQPASRLTFVFSLERRRHKSSAAKVVAERAEQNVFVFYGVCHVAFN